MESILWAPLEVDCYTNSNRIYAVCYAVSIVIQLTALDFDIKAKCKFNRPGFMDFVCLLLSVHQILDLHVYIGVNTVSTTPRTSFSWNNDLHFVLLHERLKLNPIFPPYPIFEKLRSTPKRERNNSLCACCACRVNYSNPKLISAVKCHRIVVG